MTDRFTISGSRHLLDLSANLSPVERILIADWLDQLREDPYACGTLKVGTKSTFVTQLARVEITYRVPVDYPEIVLIIDAYRY